MWACTAQSAGSQQCCRQAYNSIATVLVLVLTPPLVLSLGALLQDNTNFIHIHHWSDGRTLLHSVGLLLGSPAYEPGAAPALPSVKNCLMLSTNTTLLPALIPHAAVATPLPLLVYLTSNLTIGQHPPLPTGGIIIKRPVVFVGMQSLLTSIDFEMVVNQLNLTGSHYSNTTFVGVVLENLAPGDIVTSAVAAPFSIAITNNVWAVLYNRYVHTCMPLWDAGTGNAAVCQMGWVSDAVAATHITHVQQLWLHSLFQHTRSPPSPCYHVVCFESLCTLHSTLCAC